ncbi:DegT/DnrJ/EryC1/StrS family aminotransferase [Paenibacillus allorhizosphaerae]|uniref:dTDP-3-amino-3,4,6-trideoxy-alpha-D-glucose transaminase n=1 Tax=Paenibacillus allorhizosphaerae TaxID=2849866 RepID=A0ABM8VLY5_9BACL|nr:DegT/DnrJ/EryC1/StrS family aminotransferase [Paenibacillus allorhizosphaerae]CAG7649075.1 dTDP-3-amino-3,4,6-trideoxy-alpha-D-glucose transaminase [Paenibacillus allorhizosphaerae]
MNIPLIDLRAQYLSVDAEIQNAVRTVLHSGAYVSGPEIRSFEQEMAQFTQSQYAISTANGTDSLILALEACGVGAGDEVITSPYTFFATAEAIARVGAVPVFADIDRRTYNLSPEHVERKVTSRTKAIIPVHIFGQPAEMDAFLDIARRRHLYIIEDACQALGATYKGRPVGSIGHIGCVSFFPTKNLGGYGDGGIVLTNDEDMARKVRLLASHGSTRKYYHDAVGYNSRLDELQAAILRVKLGKLNEWNKLRREKAEYYSGQLLAPGIALPHSINDIVHVYHIYMIEFKEREALSSYLNEAGIATGHYYPCPLHLQKAFVDLGYKSGDLPAAEAASERAIALPMFPELTMEQQQYIVSRINKFIESQ